MIFFTGLPRIPTQDASLEGSNVGRNSQVLDGGRLSDRQQLDGLDLHEDRHHQPRRVLTRLGQTRR